MAADASGNGLLGKIIKLVLVCLVVGYVIQFFEITPEKVLENFGETVAAIFTMGQRLVNWASDYIVTGAIIVLPIVGIVYVFNYVNRLLAGRKDK